MNARRHHHDGAAWLALAALLALGAIVVTATAAAGRLPLDAAPLAHALDWQPALRLHQPWRMWTAVWVHWSGAHLAVNLAGIVVIAAVGWRARASATTACAWFLAWPLTQGLMLVTGAGLAAVMPHYGGLSGVLHAGVVVLGLALASPRASAPGPARDATVHASFAPSQGSTLDASRLTEGPWVMTHLGETLHPDSEHESILRPRADRHSSPAGTVRDRWIGAAMVAGTLAKVLLEAPWMLTPRPNPELGITVAPLAHACGVAAGALAWIAVRALQRRAAGTDRAD